MIGTRERRADQVAAVAATDVEHDRRVAAEEFLPVEMAVRHRLERGLRPLRLLDDPPGEGDAELAFDIAGLVARLCHRADRIRPPDRTAGASMAFLHRLRKRERIPERMDDPAIDPVDHRRALAALARINRFTNSAGVLWPSIRELAHRLARPIRLLDVATGSGDVPAALAARARKDGVSLVIAGCDCSQFAIDEARAAHRESSSSSTTRFETAFRSATTS